MESNNIYFDANQIEKIIGYNFKDKSLLMQAFTRTSFCNENVGSDGTPYQSNEVLEFFGDGVLSLAIISFMLNEFTERYKFGIKTELNEGNFSNIKSKLSDKQNLSKSTFALGIQKYLRMGEGDAKLGIENEPSVMEDLFESIIGAVYIDCDMDIKTVMKVVDKMLDISVYTKAKEPIQSPKNVLQEYCADKNRRLPPPVYKTLREDGPDHKKVYERGVFIGDELIATGVGKNQKIADAQAATNAIEILKKKNNDFFTPLSFKLDTDFQDEKIENVPTRVEKTTVLPQENIQSPKNVLQEYCADKNRRLPPPVYKTLREDGPDHNKVFERGVFIGDELIATGVGKNLKTADAQSAKNAIEILKNKYNDFSNPFFHKVDTDFQDKEIENVPTRVEKTTVSIEKDEPKKENAKIAKKKVQKTSKGKVKAKPNADERKKATSKKEEKTAPAIKAEASTVSEKNRKEMEIAKKSVGLAPHETVILPMATPLLRGQRGPSTKPSSSTAQLKSIANSQKVASPIFKDLGEVKEGKDSFYRIECIFKGDSAIGKGSTRLEARECAAKTVIDSLNSKKPTKRKSLPHTHVKNKSAKHTSPKARVQRHQKSYQ